MRLRVETGPPHALPLRGAKHKARDLADAVAQFGDAAKAGVERTMRELQELRRQQASSIVVPGMGAPGSKIQMP